MDENANTPDPIDVYLGSSIRTRRKALGLSQSALGEALGVTFQQVQKYERGFNRLSGSTLYRTARALNCTVADLFAGYESLERTAAPAQINQIAQFMGSHGGARVAALFLRCSAEQQAAIVRILEAMIPDAGGTGGEGGEPDFASYAPPPAEPLDREPAHA